MLKMPTTKCTMHGQETEIVIKKDGDRVVSIRVVCKECKETMKRDIRLKGVKVRKV